MKSFLTVLFVFAGLTSILASGFDPYKVNTDYEKAIKPVMEGIQDGAGADTYAGLLETFKGLSQSYPAEWRGYYWEAFANLRKAELLSGEEKDIALDEAERLINRAEMFIKENTELYLLRAWMLHEKINVDPVNRKEKLAPDEKWYLDQVYLMDQGNPRYFFLKGKWSAWDTTEAGKKETLRYYRSAKLMFDERPRSKYYAEPDWGRGETDVALGLIDPAAAISPSDIPVIAAEQAAAAAAASPIPNNMQGAVLPQSLLDDSAGEIVIDSVTQMPVSPRKQAFKLFGFVKRDKDKPEGADETQETSPAEDKDDTGKDDKKGDSDKADKSSKESDSKKSSGKGKKSKSSKDDEPQEEVGTDKKSKKMKQDQDKEEQKEPEKGKKRGKKK